jgi:hypothetical protein
LYKTFHQIREILVGRLLLWVEQINFSARHRERISLGMRYVDGFAISTEVQSPAYAGRIVHFAPQCDFFTGYLE